MILISAKYTVFLQKLEQKLCRECSSGKEWKHFIEKVSWQHGSNKTKTALTKQMHLANLE